MTRTQDPAELDQAVAETVRRLYVRPIDPARAHRDVTRIAEAARQADATRGPRVSAGAASTARRRRTPLWRPALVAAAALVALPGGMATAGVHLPEPLEAPYELVGISLPNQADHAADRSRPARERTRLPATTSPSATRPAAPSAERAKERARADRRSASRARQRRRFESATPAVPATRAQPPALPGSGSRATPATPATPARPHTSERTPPRSGQERKATVERHAMPELPARQQKRRFPARRGSGNRSDARTNTSP